MIILTPILFSWTEVNYRGKYFLGNPLQSKLLKCKCVPCRGLFASALFKIQVLKKYWVILLKCKMGQYKIIFIYIFPTVSSKIN